MILQPVDRKMEKEFLEAHKRGETMNQTQFREHLKKLEAEKAGKKTA